MLSCLYNSGSDSMDTGQLMLTMEEEMGKQSISNCGSQGSSLNECLQQEFTNNPESTGKVINSVKLYIKEFIEAAIQIDSEDNRSVSDSNSILTQLTEFSQDEMGIRRVDQEFLDS